MSRSIRYINCFALALLAAALLTATSCKESPRVFSNDTFRAYTGNPPGYFYPYVVNTLPANGATAVPINSSLVIVFNIPIDQTTVVTSGLPADITFTIIAYPTATGVPVTTLVEGAAADYELTWNAESTLLTVSFHYGGPYPSIPADTTVQVTLGTGIRSVENSISLFNPGMWQFATGVFPDTTGPLEATHNPTGAGISLTAPNIYIDFNEDIDPDSVNPLTLYLEDGGVRVPAALSYDSLNRRGVLAPTINLNTSTTYDVFATGGIEDLCGNAFAGTTWQFTTTAVSLDPVPGAPAFGVGSPYIGTVSPDGALMSWTTNKPTGFILNYGTNSGATDVYDETALLMPYSEYHSFYFAMPELAYDLTPNTRYWFNIELYDMYGGSYTGMATLQFNTESGETPAVVHNGAGSQYAARKLDYHPFPSGNTGFFLFWRHLPAASNQIYGQLYDSGLTPRWPSPNPVYTTGNNTYVSSVEDGMDGVIVVAHNGTNYYAKRLASDGSFHWSDTAATTGFNIGSFATISNVSAVPVYSGKTQSVTGGTTEMGFLSASTNYFFDDDFDLSVINTGHIIYDDTGHVGTTADDTGQDFNYSVGQADAGIVGSGDTYYIGDPAFQVTVTETDHEIYDTNPLAVYSDYSSAVDTDHVFTPHGYTLPVIWTLDAGDIIQSGASTTFGSLTAVNQRTPITIFDSGTADAASNTDLWDWSKWWSTGGPFVSTNDRVVNNADSLLTYVTVVANFDLTLNTPPNMNFDIGDSYSIYDRFCNDHSSDLDQFSPFYDFTVNWNISITDGNDFTVFDYTGQNGVADTLPANPLCDNLGTFDAVAAPLPVQDGDIVVNTTSGTSAVVNSMTANPLSHALGLNAGIMSDGDSYSIFRYRDTPVESGRADGAGPSLVDSAQNFQATVSEGDIAYNPVTDLYAVVTNVVSDTQLDLDRDVGFGVNVYYAVFNARNVLFVYQEGANVRGRIISMELNVPVVRRAAFTIAAGSGPWTVPDGYGRAFVVYNNASGQIAATLLNGYGYAVWSSLDTTVASIVGVKSDGAHGIVILARFGNDLYAQRVNNSGATVWAAPIDFDNDGAATVTSQEAWEYIPSDDSVIIAAKDQNNAICSWRTTGANVSVWSYGAGAPLAGIAGVVMQDPQVFHNTSDSTATILWEDNRFYNLAYIDIGYGIYGQRLTAAGARTWFPNTGGIDDTNGISVILNHYSDTAAYWPNPLAASHNNGAEAVIIWEDYRDGVTTPDLFTLEDLELFPPWP